MGDLKGDERVLSKSFNFLFDARKREHVLVFHQTVFNWQFVMYFCGIDGAFLEKCT